VVQPMNEGKLVVGELGHLGRSTHQGELDQGVMQHTFSHRLKISWLTINCGHDLGAQAK
jgi:hypothetical protein